MIESHKKIQNPKECAKHFFYLYEDYERTFTCIETFNVKKWFEFRCTYSISLTKMASLH
jgi:hypothetical protein